MTDEEELYAQAIAACQHGEWEAAARMASRLMALSPEHAGVHYLAGVACLELGRVAQAAALLGRSTMLEPTSASFAVAHAKALMLAGDCEGAIKEADRVCGTTQNAMALNTLGVVYALSHAHEKAAATFRRLLAISAHNTAARFILSTMLIFLGELDAAQVELETCLLNDPRCWKAYLALSQLSTQSVGKNHVELLNSVLANESPDEGEPALYLNMALAKEYEDLADYPRAFAHLRAGKTAGGQGKRYSIDRDRALFASIVESTAGEWNTSDGYLTDEPIFVIGMPRSGTTLVDRIISSHPEVQSAGELRNFEAALKAQADISEPAADPATIVCKGLVDWRKLGERYLSSTRPMTGKRAHFIDKLPHNFLHAGYIARALPNAKIICLRRNAMDTCLSNFRQLFALNNTQFGYSYDLLDTGRYYVLFDRIIAHWQQVIPGRILEVNYEDLVEKQEVTSRGLLRFCELGWNESCLQFEMNSAVSTTASAVQVRKPIYHTAIARWKNYAAELVQLQDLLEASGIPVTGCRQS